MDQLNKLLARLSLGQKISIAAVALLTFAGLYGFSRWRYESDFRPLYTSMAPEDAAGVVQKLRETGVEYRLLENGGAVLVPSAKLAESRLTLAAAGLPKTGRIGFELFDKSTFGATDFVEHINYKRALEGELERSVMSLAEVEQARIHLTLPKESVFLEQQQPAKASVMLKLRPGAEVSQPNVLAITNLVASAVEGLAPEGVSVVDMNGNLLSRPRRSTPADGSQITSETLEVRQQIEHDLISKIHTTLEPLLGPDRFRAGASVECDLSSGEQQEETFDPTRSVMASSQKSEDVTERASAGAGIPGTASNLPRGNSNGASGGGTTGTSRRTENVTFQTSRVIRHTRTPQGVIKRMSIAVLLDQTVRWEGEGAAKHKVFEPPKPETIQSLKGLIAAATGLNTERGDQLIIESLPFESTVNAQPQVATPARPFPKGPTGPAWLQFVTKYKDLAAPLAVAVSLLIFVVRMVVRKFTGGGKSAPELTKELEGPESPEEQARLLAALDRALPARAEDPAEMPERVRDLAKREPALAASVVRAWLREEKSRAT
jgi:flagellar M-ring protein FliF